MVKRVLVTGSLGLVGSEAIRYYCERGGYEVVGIDCDKRKEFFGMEGSTAGVLNELSEYADYEHMWIDITDRDEIMGVINEDKPFDFILHTAAQPSHDYAARDPFGDFETNCSGTLNLLQAIREKNYKCVFVTVSTNKVYGDRPNRINFTEEETRWSPNWQYYFPLQDLSQELNSNEFLGLGFGPHGINEEMPVDQCTHSLFGASKLYSDIITQEYGRYFPEIFHTGVFRGGCLTGSCHQGTQLHGFLSYLVKCFVKNKPYTVFGYNGKQVRDNIHVKDLIRAFDCFFQDPKAHSAVYNIGGGMFSNISMLEAINKLKALTCNEIPITMDSENRIGDHIWYISDTTKFKGDYPGWEQVHNIDMILEEMVESASQ